MLHLPGPVWESLQNRNPNFRGSKQICSPSSCCMSRMGCAGTLPTALVCTDLWLPQKPSPRNTSCYESLQYWIRCPFLQTANSNHSPSQAFQHKWVGGGASSEGPNGGGGDKKPGFSESLYFVLSSWLCSSASRQITSLPLPLPQFTP